MPMIRRRRPLLRAAVVGGAAHHAGKVSGERNAMREEQGQAYEAPPAAPTPGASGGLSPEAMQQLKELGQLQQSGVLTSEEFEQQKAKLLAASG